MSKAFPYKICKRSQKYEEKCRRESVLEIRNVHGIIHLKNKNDAEQKDQTAAESEARNE